MTQTRKVFMAAGTFSAALGIGFLMQNGDALAARMGGNQTPPPVVAVEPAIEQAQVYEPTPLAPVAEPAQATMAVMNVDAITSAAAPILAAVTTESLPMMEGDAVAAGTGNCAPTMVGTALSDGMVGLNILAPCSINTRFTLHHQGMFFTQMTDEMGMANITVPALAEHAVFIAAFDNSEGAVAELEVPEVAGLERAVLQWQDDTAVQIQAFEYGADYGDTGNVSAENPRSQEALGVGEGYIMTLGDETLPHPMLAQVYTFPMGDAVRDGKIEISVEAEVTVANCGRELTAQSLQFGPTGETAAVDLVVTMPDCDATGEFLVLKDMFNDLSVTVAAN